MYLKTHKADKLINHANTKQTSLHSKENSWSLERSFCVDHSHFRADFLLRVWWTNALTLWENISTFQGFLSNEIITDENTPIYFAVLIFLFIKIKLSLTIFLECY